MSMIEESVPHSAPSKPLPTPRRTSEENTMLNPNSVASPATLSTTTGAAHVRFPHFSLRISERRLVLLVVDVALINLALLLAVVLFTDFAPSIDNILAVSKWFIVLTAVWYCVALFFNCYDLARSASVLISVRSIVLAAGITIVIYTFIPYLTPPLTSRGLIFYFALMMIASLAIWRVIYARVFVQPWFQQRALVVGAGNAGQTLANAIQTAGAKNANPYQGTGYQLVGFIDDNPLLRGHEIEGITVLGDQESLVQIAKQQHIDEIILAITHRHNIADELFDALLRCREMGLRVVTMAIVFERLTGRVPIDHVGRDLEMVVPTHDNAGERAYLLIKRGIDILAALAGLMVMGLVAPAVWLINQRTSPGPLMYRQRRVGQGGRIFEIYKFRSMRPDAEKGTGAVWARKNDDRITPAGRFLRKTRLDELPQCLNILKGDMSLIGPRPERPEFVNALSLILPFYRARHAVKPGLTGWAQVRYGYGSTKEDAHTKLEYDLYYVKHASLLLDIMIILQTAPVMLLAKGT